MTLATAFGAYARRPMLSLSQRDVREVHPSIAIEDETLVESAEQRAMQWARAHIEPLRGLPLNWDSYGGLPSDDGAVEIAIGIVAGLAISKVPTPSIIPTADGGISLEWHDPNRDFVITVPPLGEGDPSAYFWNSAGEEWTISSLMVLDPRFSKAVSGLRGAAAP